MKFVLLRWLILLHPCRCDALSEELHVGVLCHVSDVEQVFPADISEEVVDIAISSMKM